MKSKHLLLYVFLLFIGGCAIFTPDAGQDVAFRFAEGGYGAGITVRPADSFNRLPGDTVFRFIIGSDFHHYGAKRPAHPFFAWFSAWFAAAANPPAFGIIAGDCTETGSLDEFRLLREDFDNLPGSFPMYFTTGNHDIMGNGWDAYYAYLGTASYTFTAGNTRILVLDSASAILGKKQLAWLEETLAANTSTHTFVITHYPATMGSFVDIDRSPDPLESAYRMHLYEKYGVNAEISGHIHYYQHFNIRGVNYFTLSALKEYVSHKMLLEVSIDGDAVSYTVIPVEYSYE